MYTGMGEAFSVQGREIPFIPEDYDLCKMYFQLVGKLMGEGKLKAHPHKLGEKGLVGVFDGLEMLRKGEVSGVKLVYKVEDTPGL